MRGVSTAPFDGFIMLRADSDGAFDGAAGSDASDEERDDSRDLIVVL